MSESLDRFAAALLLCVALFSVEPALGQGDTRAGQCNLVSHPICPGLLRLSQWLWPPAYGGSP